MKIIPIVAVSLAMLCMDLELSPQVPTQANGREARRLAELEGSFVEHRYRSDSGRSFQYGTPPVEFGVAGAVGMTSKRGAFGTIEGLGLNERIRTKNLPTPVLAAAGRFVNPTLDLGTTSLRLQDAWGFGVGVYALHDVEIGARYQRDSWRYDWLGNSAGSTIPYLKGVMSSRIGFIRYTGEVKKLQFVLDGGGGTAAVDFRQGTESYLRDGQETLLARLPSGISVPASARLGYALLKPDPMGSDEKTAVIPYIRYDYEVGRLAGTSVTKRQVVFGVEVVFGAR